jgi:hypothetical protein
MNYNYYFDISIFISLEKIPMGFRTYIFILDALNMYDDSIRVDGELGFI